MTDTAVSTHEADEVAAANATGKQPVVFVHGLWLLPSSWDRWAKLFDDAGYVSVLPHWPDDPETVAEANADPKVFAGKGDRRDRGPPRGRRRPARRASRRSSATPSAGSWPRSSPDAVDRRQRWRIDAAPFRGVLPLPISALKSAFPVLGNPLNRSKAVPLTYDQFRFGFTNAVERGRSEAAARDLRGPGGRQAAVPGGIGEPQPVDRGEGRHQEPRSRPAPAHLGREGQHRPVVDHEGLVRPAEGQPRGHRGRHDPGPRAFAHDRQRLAGGRGDLAGVRQALRLAAAPGRGPHPGATLARWMVASSSAIFASLIALWVAMLVLFWALRPEGISARQIVGAIPDVLRLLRSLIGDRSTPLDVRDRADRPGGVDRLADRPDPRFHPGARAARRRRGRDRRHALRSSSSRRGRSAGTLDWDARGTSSS